MAPSKTSSDRALDYIRACYLRANYTHPSTGGIKRQVAESEAEEFALIFWRYTVDDEVRVAVSERAIRRMESRLEKMWRLPHHNQAKVSDKPRKRIKVKTGNRVPATSSKSGPTRSRNSASSNATGNPKLKRLLALKRKQQNER